MAWLSTFEKRIKLTLDNTNVDDTLSDFPVLIKLSDSSGISSTDVTSIFTELGSDANRKKIAVTTSDGTTQCYVEIERFDYSNSVAWLWIKAPTVVSGTTTTLYFYYDSGQTDNTTYVGDTGDTPAQSVWDSNFKLVMHMAQDPNGDVVGCMKDSTSNQCDGTPVGSMTSADLVDGKIGKGIESDSDDQIVINEISIFDFGTGDYSAEAIIKRATAGTNRALLGTSLASGALIFLYMGTDGVLRTYINNALYQSAGSNVCDGTWHYVNVSADRNGLARFYVDGVQNGNTPNISGTSTFNIDVNTIYLSKHDGFTGIGTLDEVRISNTDRSAAWIKATYYSNWDELVSFGSEELCITLTFTNPTPVHLSTVYGTTEQLQLTTTVSGYSPNYTYNAAFYDEYDVQIGTTIYGVNSGSPAVSNTNLPTPSGVAYNWYVIATSSGISGISQTYTFSNRFLYEGYVTEEDTPVNRVIRLYYRDTGGLIDSTISSGIDGYYRLNATTNDEHFIVAFDNEAGEYYNALILDRLLPNGE